MEIGNEVKHKKYGYGIIIGDDGSDFAVLFSKKQEGLHNFDNNIYFGLDDDLGYWCCEDELELINIFRPGMVVEVRDCEDGKWRKADFICFDYQREGNKYWCAELNENGEWYKYCRIPQPKPQVDLSFKVNGKEVDISNLSKETVENILKEVW
jgi:hypothetical protein